MEYIELVIKIPEYTYKEIVNDEEYGIERVRKAVINGTPLPKGHGRLIDADDLIKRLKQYIDIPDKYISQRNKDFIYFLEREEVIIPADKAESEDKE